MYSRVAGAYDSNIALIIADGATRHDNLARLADILRRTELRGEDVQNNMPVHYGLLTWILGHDAMFKPSTQFMDLYLTGVGALARTVSDLDLEVAWVHSLDTVPSKEAKAVLRLKETLLLRPLARLLRQPHLLAGFLGLHDGRLWRREGERLRFAQNPLRALERAYHFLNLDRRDGQVPSMMIWDHDYKIMSEGLQFYAALEQRLGESDWAKLCSVLEKKKAPAGFGGDAALWEAVQAAHAGYQLGLDLLLLLPRAGQRAGFFEITVDDDLSVSFPEAFRDKQFRADRQRQLAPPPVASSDEIVTPMGGHFYSREAPHLSPLIEEGARFVAGQPLFVIEVMKMFNKVSVPFSGRVTQAPLHHADGTIVKKGQLILKIEADEKVVIEAPEHVAARRREATLGMLSSLASG
jgi:biotin carboxyl carrier protein